MKLSDGIEQALHCATLLAALPTGARLSAKAMADFHGVSTSYLLKHLQALSKAGLLHTEPGPRGGYRLARAPDRITLLDVVLAVEGPEPAFRCKEIRQNGPDPLPAKHFKAPCQINAAMLRAERAYRAELRGITLADLLAELAQADTDGTITARGCAFFDSHIRHSKP
ncbi:Rrf2 family transcriptional regulator [uncultured Roseobacter sp.]|uniref:RrF2 family transcriptional regulator n=1 Tax=uncultured Roseobacter sp. TaxID=114847 RepID=UPI002605671B|nr:Rrf2 family transcriptional regulator [uncultured Roseobacter sp.]